MRLAGHTGEVKIQRSVHIRRFSVGSWYWNFLVACYLESKLSVTKVVQVKLMDISIKNMKAPVENYKGIEFVRISSLPEDQKKAFWDSFDRHKIIKIMRNQELLNDCIQYNDYQEWSKEIDKSETITLKQQELRKEFKFVFK